MWIFHLARSVNTLFSRSVLLLYSCWSWSKWHAPRGRAMQRQTAIVSAKAQSAKAQGFPQIVNKQGSLHSCVPACLQATLLCKCAEKHVYAPRRSCGRAA